MKTFDMTTQEQVRDYFWHNFPDFERRGHRVRQNAYSATIRSAFVDFVDMLERDGQISEKLASRVTL